MNENINLVEILKDCPRGTKLYSSLFEEVKFDKINTIAYPTIDTIDMYGDKRSFLTNGKYVPAFPNAECMLFPSKDQRDWTKFTAPWYKPEESTISPSKEQRDWSKVISLWCKYEKKETVKKKEKFNPQTLHEFDKVLVRDGVGYKWNADFYSYKLVGRGHRCVDDTYDYCIPYNDDTKHLIGTNGEAPEYYRYWDDRNVVRKR